MARRKKSRKVSRRRRSRSRMGAVGKGMFGDALTIIGGAVLGGVVKKFVIKPATQGTPASGEVLANALVLGAGIFLPTLVKGNMGAKLGAGMIAYGGVGLAKKFIDPDGKFIGAMDDTLSIPMRVGEIEDNLSVIAGSPNVMAGDPLSVIAGYEEDGTY